MPIGKNALKRVSNNGYSNVKATAPDMENSSVLEPTSEVKEAPKVKETSAKISPKKNNSPAAKRPAVKKPEMKKAEKKAEKTEKISRPDGFVRYELGADLPEHLL